MTPHRQRWTVERQKKEPSLYAEWLHQEKKATQQQQELEPHHHSRSPTPPSWTDRLPLRNGPGHTTPAQRESAGTIRAVSPDSAVGTELDYDQSYLPLKRRTSSVEHASLPPFAATVAAAPRSTTPSIPPSSSAKRLISRRLMREGEREAYAGQNRPSSNGSGSMRLLGPGMSARSSSVSNGEHARGAIAVTDVHEPIVRPRTRTLEDRRRREESPTAIQKQRKRIGSVHTPSSPLYQGAEFLASSVPADFSPPSAPSLSSLSSPMPPPPPPSGHPIDRRSTSPTATAPLHSVSPHLPVTSGRRVVHLMKTLKGRMSGSIFFRRGSNPLWSQSYGYVNKETSSLIHEPAGGNGSRSTLVPDLRGCSVRADRDGDTPYLEIRSPDLDFELYVKPLSRADFDAWFATFLYWQSLDPATRPTSAPNTPAVAATAMTTMTDTLPDSPPPRQRDRATSSKSDRRTSVVGSVRDMPVIKIGRMVFWDINVARSHTPTGVPIKHSLASARPQVHRGQSYGSRRWRRISGQLRENGELKLHSDADNSLISVVQLSQLSRCAIQRLDPSVLDVEFCIAIYPQYTSNPNPDPPSFLQPMYLSLESRVLYEVWFVLLRAFTIPSLYGPSNAAEESDMDGTESSDQEDPLAAATTAAAAAMTTTSDMFRVERSLSVRVIEARVYPPPMDVAAPDSGFSGGHSRNGAAKARLQTDGHFAEILLDNETRARTGVKYEGSNPLWGQTFEFLDLPTVLTSANVVIKRRPPDAVHQREQAHAHKLAHEALESDDLHSGYTGLSLDVTCGRVEIYLQELEAEKEVEKWWPVVNTTGQQVGEVSIKARADERVILMARDYTPLSDLLHHFGNNLTLQIAQLVSGELKALSDCLLNIYQVSGRASDWLVSLVDEEVDGLQKDSAFGRLQFVKRGGASDGHDGLGPGATGPDRELLVRDLNKNATLEANLLFRGNTLLTKSLDTHMRRVGKEYLEESLAAKIRELNDKDQDCEVDPNRVAVAADVDRGWRRLLLATQELWQSIVAARQRCPIELKLIFRHIRACADERYGAFLRTVNYSSVSGFLFLRFFCPAVLNPQLFGIVKDDVKPRTRRTLTLIAKSLQTLGNMASFGTKERWMEPMNAFLVQNRETFKTFVDDICYVPTPLSTSIAKYPSANSSPTYPPGFVTAETHLSYTTPMTIMQRLPPTSREGFPSLPYLIDQARAFADLVQLWLEATNPAMTQSGIPPHDAKKQADIRRAIHESGPDLVLFDEICLSLNTRTQECLSRAERAERPNSSSSFRWDDLIDQLHETHAAGEAGDEPASYDALADRLAGTPGTLSPRLPPHRPVPPTEPRDWDGAGGSEDDDEPGAPAAAAAASSSTATPRDRPASSGFHAAAHTLQGTLRRALHSRGSEPSPPSSAPASAPASHASSSAVSSDAEHAAGTTALPSYAREVRRHRERREAAKLQIQRQVEEARAREREKERRRGKTPLSALRKKKDRDWRGPVGGSFLTNPALVTAAAAAAAAHPASPAGSTVTVTPATATATASAHRQGVDMSHV